MSEHEWHDFTGMLKERWPRLAGDILDVLRDTPDMLIGRLQAHYRITREEAERIYEAFTKELLTRHA